MIYTIISPSAIMAITTRGKQEIGQRFVRSFRTRVLVRVWRQAYAERKEEVLSKHAMAVWQMVSKGRGMKKEEINGFLTTLFR